MKEAVEIRLHPRNINRDRDFILSHSWYLVTNTAYQLSKDHTQSQTWALERSIFGMVWTHSHYIAVMIGLEMVPETSAVFNQLTLLTTQENFINISHNENFTSYIN